MHAGELTKREIQGWVLNRFYYQTRWQHGSAFERLRGEAWMEAPCRGCHRRALDFGGCRCQAFALTGRATATDPACSRSPDHLVISRARAHAEAAPSAPLIYRSQ